VVNGTLVWSKKTRSQGFFDKAEASLREPVYAAIRAASSQKTSDYTAVPMPATASADISIQYCGG